MTQPTKKGKLKAKLESAFPGIRFTKIVVSLDQSLLSWEAVQIYSYLVYKLAESKGQTKGCGIRQLSRETGIYNESVRKAIRSLVSHALASCSNDRYIGAEPVWTRGWFQWKKVASPDWYRNLSYYWAAIRSSDSPLSARTNDLLFRLYNLQASNQTITAKFLVGGGRNKNTITTSIRQLRKNGLCTKGLTPIFPDDDSCLHWWRGEGQSPVKKWKFSDVFLGDSKHHSAEILRKLFDHSQAMLSAAKYTHKDIDQLFADKWELIVDKYGNMQSGVDTLISFLLAFPAIFATLDKQHHQNTSYSHYPNSKRLVRTQIGLTPEANE